jgi:uroporphyrinogen decarboxylase
MRGYAEWLMDLLAEPVFAEALLTRIVDWFTEVAIRALGEAGEHVDLVVFGDDLGTQNQALMRPELYRRLIKPQHRRIIDTVKRFGKPILLHSCGSISALIPDLIEAGVDALNPIQVSAANMDTKMLKREFGQDLTFWGAVDNQRVLPGGTVREVREEVRRRIEDLASGGGYVLCATQDIQADVPPENVVAMYEEARVYRKYQ